MLARLAAWLDRIFWPELPERQPCLTASEIIRRNGWDEARLARMRPRVDATLVGNRAMAAVQAACEERLDMIRRVDRARSLRVSLC